MSNNFKTVNIFNYAELPISPRGKAYDIDRWTTQAKGMHYQGLAKTFCADKHELLVELQIPICCDWVCFPYLFRAFFQFCFGKVCERGPHPVLYLRRRSCHLHCTLDRRTQARLTMCVHSSMCRLTGKLSTFVETASKPESRRICSSCACGGWFFFHTSTALGKNGYSISDCGRVTMSRRPLVSSLV